jgi:hypothetical protein
MEVRVLLINVGDHPHQYNLCPIFIDTYWRTNFKYISMFWINVHHKDPCPILAIVLLLSVDLSNTPRAKLDHIFIRLGSTPLMSPSLPGLPACPHLCGNGFLLGTNVIIPG